MKTKLLFNLTSIIILVILVVTGCKKDNTTPKPPVNNAHSFLTNTQWVGSYHIVSPGREYDPPCCLKFNSDTTVILYSFFVFNVNNTFIEKDSINGVITGIDSTSADRSTRVTVNFPEINDHQTMLITNRQKLTSTTADANKPNVPISITLESFPAAAPSLTGTAWHGMFKDSYPDLNTIEFRKSGNNNVTVYFRNGNYAPETATPQIPTPGILQVLYVQQGAMVYMSGYNEENRKLVPYFGVLTPSGDKMWVDSRSMYARLPNYVQTAPIYGPIGATPVIAKN